MTASLHFKFYDSSLIMIIKDDEKVNLQSYLSYLRKDASGSAAMYVLFYSNIDVNYVHYKRKPELCQTESRSTYTPLLLNETITVSDFL